MDIQIRSKRSAGLRAAATTIALAALSAAAGAAPIHYEHSGYGWGTLAGVAFGTQYAPVVFTITATSDTSLVTACAAYNDPGCLAAKNISASIAIDTVGTFDFISDTRYFSNVGVVGFGRYGADIDNNTDLFSAQPLPGWDMMVSVGPVTGNAWLLQWDTPFLPRVVTTGGVLTFESAWTPALFSATVVPEPATGVLALTGLAAAWAVRGRGCRRAA